MIDINAGPIELDPATPEQVANEWKLYCMDMCRTERDKRLAETDYIHMPDVDISESFKEAIIAYRKELRNFPDTFSMLYDNMTEDEQDGVTPQSLPFPTKPDKNHF